MRRGGPRIRIAGCVPPRCEPRLLIDKQNRLRMAHKLDRRKPQEEKKKKGKKRGKRFA
jgi:hypothetical protein